MNKGLLDIKKYKAMLRKEKLPRNWYEPFGHMWVPVDNVSNSVKKGRKRVMGGLWEKIDKASEFLIE